MRSILNNSGAISFVEVIVTSVVFAVAAFGIFATLSSSTRGSQATSQKLEAAYVGKAALEDLRRRIQDDTEWNDAGGNFEVGVVKNYAGPAVPAGYTVTYILADDPDYPVRQISLNVTY